MRKKFKLLVLTVLSVTLLCAFASCEKAGTELSELMIMQGIGIDLTRSGYKVTVEILNNEQSGSPNGDSSSENKTKIYSAQGETVSEALYSLTERSGNLPMFAHNRVIVIGEAAANKNLSDIIDFFERNYDSRPSQLLCVAKGGDAESVIRAELLNDSVKSEILENMLDESYKQSLVPRVRVIDAVNLLKEETSGVCIPSVLVQKNGDNENYVLDGCAIFGLDSSLSGYIDSSASNGIAYLNDKIEKGTLTAELPNGKKATFSLSNGKTRYKISENNGVLIYNLNIDVSCEIIEVEGDEFFSADSSVLETFRECAGKAICKKAENTIITLQSTHGADVVRYGKRLKNKNTELYNFLKTDWDNVFKTAKTNITVDVTIRRIGEETFHSKKG